jgi:hypothetical protein
MALKLERWNSSSDTLSHYARAKLVVWGMGTLELGEEEGEMGRKHGKISGQGTRR